MADASEVSVSNIFYKPVLQTNLYKPVECIYLASEFSKNIKTSKKASKVSN